MTSLRKRDAKGKFIFVRRCSNQLHHVVAAGAAIDLERDGVFVSKLSAEVRSEWAKENKDKAKVLSGGSTAKRLAKSYLLCKVCKEYFQSRCEGSIKLDTDSAAASASKSDNSQTAGPSTSSKSTGSGSTTSGSTTDTESTITGRVISSTSTQSSVLSVLEQLKTLNTEELAEVAHFLGQSQRTAVKNDIKQLPANSVGELCDFDVNKWNNSRNPVVTAFLKGLTDPKHTVDNSRQVDLAKAIEHIYHLQNKKVVLPLSLSENLVSYSVARSKLVCNTNASSSPAGSHTYVTNWLKSQAADPLPPPVGDVIVAFDNDQVIGKTYHIRSDNKVKSSVITSVCFAEVQPDGHLQCREDLKGGKWQTDDNLTEAVGEILDNESSFNKAVNSTHYKQLYCLIQERLTVVDSQQVFKDEKWQDHVDDEVASNVQRKGWKLCWVCGTNNLKTKRVCVSCGSSLNAVPTVPEPGPSYSSPPNKPKEKKSFCEITFSYLDTEPGKKANTGSVNVRAGEPIFVNPNSHSSIITVFRDIGRQVKISKYCANGQREWVAITCDGLPFTIAQKVLKDTYTCQICHKAIFERKKYILHCKDHAEFAETCETDLPYILEFDWVLLKIGHGHFEMNMIRSFFKLNWDVFVKDLARCMGFCSENAQKYAKSAADHHKSWELLQILYLGSVDELVLPYVRECKLTGTKPSAENFFRWSSRVQNPRFKYLEEQMLTYATAIFNLRRGIRCNDMALVLAGRVKYAPIFHCRNHPKYQQIEMIELANFLAAPPLLQNFLSKYQAISTSGDKERSEDMDFVLEALNKKSKSWVPKGVPTNADWQRIFRNLHKFDELRSAVYGRMRREDPDAEQYVSSHGVREDEVTAWRTCLRESHFLDDPLTADASFRSVSSDKLDPQLVHLTEMGTKRRKHFASKLYGLPVHGDSVSEPEQVYITEAEREYHTNIRNQKKEVIAARVLASIDAIDDEGIQTMLLSEWETIKNRKREDFINFFLRVEEEVSQQELASAQGEESE